MFSAVWPPGCGSVFLGLHPGNSGCCWPPLLSDTPDTEIHLWLSSRQVPLWKAVRMVLRHQQIFPCEQRDESSFLVSRNLCWLLFLNSLRARMKMSTYISPGLSH